MEEMQVIAQDTEVDVTESAVTETAQEPVKEDDASFAMRMMQIRNQIAAAKSVRNELEQKKDTFSTDEIVRAHISSVVKGMTLDHIKTMSDSAVDDVFSVTDMDGKKHSLSVDLVIDDAQKQTEFKRDFLIYEKESQTAFEQIDSTLEAMEKEFASAQDEMDRIVKDCGGSLTEVIKNKLLDSTNDANLTDEQRATKKVISDAFEDSFKLDRVVLTPYLVY